MSTRSDKLDPAGAIAAALNHSNAAFEHLAEADRYLATGCDPSLSIAHAQIEAAQAQTCVLLDMAASLRRLVETRNTLVEFDTNRAPRS